MSESILDQIPGLGAKPAETPATTSVVAPEPLEEAPPPPVIEETPATPEEPATEVSKETDTQCANVRASDGVRCVKQSGHEGKHYYGKKTPAKVETPVVDDITKEKKSLSDQLEDVIQIQTLLIKNLKEVKASIREFDKLKEIISKL